ncbi:hypothetical protein AK812_SmicGene47544 [Symbiodinium microadriaticum]|uniref:Uncharacterized protein n=1 Tax=Symbiodinium microadriaticum TaxID=2951 RepID=A0A1Q9BRE9_SYMMI|nr:hypothetical protein AK812_SmicGene47544 [Symbiodinium microadriaticum]
MQELGLAYECLSTSETEAEYRAYQIANHPAIRHQHCSLEDQLQGMRNQLQRAAVAAVAVAENYDYDYEYDFDNGFSSSLH